MDGITLWLSGAKARAAAAYDAADRYECPACSYRSRVGRRTVERLGLAPGARVLDVGCGTGASALPAAERVGIEGRVIAVDLAEDLLALARAKARCLGLDNVDFRFGDMEELRFPDRSFDAVVSVFSIYFVDDMERQVARLWRMLRPGGTLAITTWGPRALEPATSAFWSAVAAACPDLVPSVGPWNRITVPAALLRLLEVAGAQPAEIVAEPGRQGLLGPEDWWDLVLGSGLRGTLEQMGQQRQLRVRDAYLELIRETGADSAEVNSLLATGRKPA